MSKLEYLLNNLQGVEQNPRKQDDWVACCPAHNDNDPSLHINVKHGRILLKCFTGCTNDEIMDALGMEMRDLFLEGSEHVEYIPKPKEYIRTCTYTATGLHHAARDFFANRGLPPEFVESFNVSGDSVALYFPYYRDEQLINIKTRKLTKPGARKVFFLEDEHERIFYGLDDCTDAEQIVICEGEIDWLTLKLAGFNPLSVPNGASDREMPWLDSAIDLLHKAKRVVIAGDMDEVGQKMRRELIRRIGPGRCLTVDWPGECNDANEVLTKMGIETVKAWVDNATPVPVDGVFSPSDISSEYEYFYDHGTQRGLSTGWPSLDRFYTVLPKYITLVTGMTTWGKSEFLDAMMINMALSHNWRFVVYSPENFPLEEHLSRWAQRYIGKPFLGRDRMSKYERDKAKEWADSHIRFLSPEEPTIDTILELAETEIRRFGINALVIDPWNEIEHSYDKNMREDQYLSKVLRRLRRFAEQHNIHIFVVCHPHQMQKDRDTKQYPEVDINDVAGGAMWGNKIGAMLSVWRDNINPGEPVKIYVKKAKTMRIGKKGRVNLSYDRRTGIYTDTGEYFEGA